MLGGEEVCLDVNFRSTPEVVGFVNFVFSTLMAESARPWEFAYEPLRASRIGDVGSVEILLCPKAATRAAGCRRRLRRSRGRSSRWLRPGKNRSTGTRLLPRRVRGYCHPPRAPDKPYLLRVALRRYGIPYHVYAGLGFYQRQEVYDLYNILRFLENERDDVALYGALRSPYFGISDARLFAVADSGPRSATLWKRLRRFASGRTNPTSRQPPPSLNPGRGSPAGSDRQNSSTGSSLNQGSTRSMAECLKGKQVIANVEKLIGIVRDLQEGGSSLGEIVGELELCIDGEEREGGGTARPCVVRYGRGHDGPRIQRA